MIAIYKKDWIQLEYSRLDGIIEKKTGCVKLPEPEH